MLMTKKQKLLFYSLSARLRHETDTAYKQPNYTIQPEESLAPKQVAIAIAFTVALQSFRSLLSRLVYDSSIAVHSACRLCGPRPFPLA